MWKIFSLLVVILALLAHRDQVAWRSTKSFLIWQSSTENEKDSLDRARTLLAAYPLVDGHADVPLQLRLQMGGDVKRFGENFPIKKTGTYLDGMHADLPKLRQGGTAMQVWASWVPPQATELDSVTVGMQQVELSLAAVEYHSQDLTLVLTPSDVERQFYSGRIGILLGLEGGQAIGNSIEILRAYYRLGVRLMTLLHTGHLLWATSSDDWAPELGGLSSFGKQVIQEMNRLGMIIDLSHASWKTAEDVLKITQAPVIYSHSNTDFLCPTPRNVPDYILDEVKKNKGLVMVTLPEQFVVSGNNSGTAKYNISTVKDVVNHIHHIADRIGVDHVGWGSDFDGCQSIPVGLKHAGEVPNLIAELLASGRYTDQDIVKFMGGNFVRVWTEVENVSKSMKGNPIENKFFNGLKAYDNKDTKSPDCHFQWDSLFQEERVA